MNERRQIIAAFIFLAVCFLGYNSIYIVTEKDQAVVFQFGAPVKVSEQPGLHFKIPFLQNVQHFEDRILEWDGMPAEIPLGGKRVSIDTFARWRISDPLKFYERVADIEVAKSRIGSIVEGVVRDEISISLVREVVADKQSLREGSNDYEDQVQYCEQFSDEPSSNLELGSKSCPESCIWVPADGNKYLVDVCKAGKGRSMITNQINSAVMEKLKNIDIGIEFVDFQIKRINYTTNVRQKVYEDIRAERNKEAIEYREDGKKEAKEIIAGAELRQKTIYGESYSRDPEFFQFWEKLQALVESFDKQTKIITTDDSDGVFDLFDLKLKDK